jgi:hypothetical protein
MLRDVAGTVQHLLRPGEPDDGDRRLGGDPLDLAVHETVEHDVTDAEDDDVGEIHAVRLSICPTASGQF